LAGNDDLGTKARLLYKKVIARFVAELERGGPPRARAGAARQLEPGPIDLEYAEADRTFGGLATGLRRQLKLYREPAPACMGLRRPAMGQGGPAAVDAQPARGRLTPQAIEKLRALTIEYGNGCERLKRENVEILLLALEILLTPGIEPDGKKL